MEKWGLLVVVATLERRPSLLDRALELAEVERLLGRRRRAGGRRGSLALSHLGSCLGSCVRREGGGEVESNAKASSRVKTGFFVFFHWVPCPPLCAHPLCILEH